MVEKNNTPVITPKPSFEEFISSSLSDKYISRKEAKEILDRLSQDKAKIIESSQDSLRQLKEHFEISIGDIDSLEKKLKGIISNTAQNNLKFDSPKFQRLDERPADFSQKSYTSYEQLDAEIIQINGKSLFDLVNTNGVLDDAGITKQEFQNNFKNYISIFKSGIPGEVFSIYSAFAEEANFNLNSDGKYKINGFSGMNIPHKIALEKFNKMLSNITLDKDGNVIGGIGKINLDVGENQNGIELTINFDTNAISPEIFFKTLLSSNSINIDHVKAFIHLYTKTQEGQEKPIFIKEGNEFKINSGINPDSINILNTSNNPRLLGHEIQHSLYSADPRYREVINQRVRNSTEEQKNAAVLVASCAYDVFDPDMKNINKGIVIDEIFNAYNNEGSYDYKTMQSSLFDIYSISEKYGINTDGIFDGIDKIDQLPISKYTITLKKDFANSGKSDEKEFIKNDSEQILRGCGDFKFLLDFIIKSNSEFYNKITNTRKNLLDGV